MATPPFIDAVHAAELLHVSQDTVLDWIKEGRLTRFSGPAGNPFLRSRDVLALAEEIGATAQPEPPKRMKSAAAKVQTRLTSDARWVDVSEAEIQDWASRADHPRRQAARTAALIAQQRLEFVVRAIDEVERGEF